MSDAPLINVNRTRIKELEQQVEDCGKTIAKLRGRCEAMREALEQLVDNRIKCSDGDPATHAWLGPETRAKILAALQPDAGARCYTLEQVKPLVEALHGAWASLAYAIVMQGDHFDLSRSECSKALDYASFMGFNV